MSKFNSKGNQDFDCSAYLSHGLKWPANECNDYNRSKAGTDNRGHEYYTNYSKQQEINSVGIQDWGALLREQVNAVSEQEKSALLRGETNSVFGRGGEAKKSSEEHYYESEYSSLIKWIDKEEIIVPPPSQFADRREEIQQISLVADEVLNRRINYNYSMSTVKRSTFQNKENKVAINAVKAPQNRAIDFHNGNKSSQERSSSSMNEHLANEIALKVLETPRAPPRVMSPGGFQNFVEEQLVGFGEVSEKKSEHKTVFRKRRLCRHFVKGFCIRGDSCDFLHDPSVFCTDEQQVFLGGLPLHFTPALLKSKLEEQGLTVLNEPRIMRGFTPKVCLGSIEEAKKLISQRAIFIDEHRLDVRPYQDKNQLRKGLPSVVKRSVFLGGLPENTTGEMIVADLQRLDVKVVDHPVIKDGYAPRVVLGSVENAKMLTSLKRVMVNGTAVDVRPYVNFRKRY